MITLTTQNLYDILNGVVILASGGGGPYALGEELLNYIVQSGKSVQLANPLTDLPSNALTVVCISVGAADAPLGSDPVQVAVQGVQAMQQTLGRTVNFILPGESGAVNTLYAMALGVALNLPVVDADLGRRSIPSLSMSALGNVSPNPMILTGEGNQMTVYAQNTAQADDAIRGIGSTNLFGDDATVTLWPLPTATLQSFVTLNSVSYALGLGQALRNANSSGQNPVNTVVNYLGGRLIFTGYITYHDETVSGGFDIGAVCLEWFENKRVWIYNQNENLIAWSANSDQPLGIGPDLLCYLTTTGIPFTNGDLFRADKQSVALIGAPCVSQLTQGGILNAWLQTLQGIGYGGAYVPIMQLASVSNTASDTSNTDALAKDLLKRAERPTRGQRQGRQVITERRRPYNR